MSVKSGSTAKYNHRIITANICVPGTILMRHTHVIFTVCALSFYQRKLLYVKYREGKSARCEHQTAPQSVPDGVLHTKKHQSPNYERMKDLLSQEEIY